MTITSSIRLLDKSGTFDPDSINIKQVHGNWGNIWKWLEGKVKFNARYIVWINTARWRSERRNLAACWCCCMCLLVNAATLFSNDSLSVRIKQGARETDRSLFARSDRRRPSLVVKHCAIVASTAPGRCDASVSSNYGRYRRSASGRRIRSAAGSWMEVCRSQGNAGNSQKPIPGTLFSCCTL